MAVQFEWDREKAERNLYKHGVSFTEAITAFDDPLSVTVPDLSHSVNEERFWIVGESNRGRLLVVAHTDDGRVIRLISARLATSVSERAMKHQSDDDELPRTIDFSGGIRGKYVDRYREGISVREIMSADPIRSSVVQSRLGYGLWHTQAFERTLVVYLSLLFDIAPRVAGTEALQLLEGHSSSTLERITQQPGLERDVSEELDRRLRFFFRERNWLVHRSWSQIDAYVSDFNKADDLLLRLESLVNEAQYLNHRLNEMLEHRLLERGLTGQEITSRAREVRDLWAAA